MGSMILLLAAALGGGVVSFTVLWPHGALIALAGAQLGATILMFMASLLLALRRAKVERMQERRVQTLLESLDQRGLSLAMLDPLTGHTVKILTSTMPC
jgi:hypothetical protein